MIIGHVLGNSLANPGVERKCALGAASFIAALDAENVGPLIGEEITVLRRLQKLIDKLVALLRIIVGEKSSYLIGRRQRAGYVERHAANELFVGAQIGGHDAQFLPFLVREAIHDGLWLELVLGSLHA